MKKRRKIPTKASKRKFTRGAVKTHWKNTADRPQRGGIRM